MMALLKRIVQGEALVFVQSALWSVPPLVRTSREAWVKAFLDVWLEATQPDTTLVMPTFTFAYCRTRTFSRAETPSEAGQLTEAFRGAPGVQRSAHPIYSVAALGPLAAEVCRHPGPTCLGEGTPFEYMEEHDALVVGFGKPFIEGLTLIHRVEEMQRVSYRYFKTFQGTADGQAVSPNFYVRRLDTPVKYDYARLCADLEQRGVLRRYLPEAGWVETMRTRAFVRRFGDLLAADPLYLVAAQQPVVVDRA